MSEENKTPAVEPVKVSRARGKWSPERLSAWVARRAELSKQGVKFGRKPKVVQARPEQAEKTPETPVTSEIESVVV